jgi:hypothetical protein
LTLVISAKYFWQILNTSKVIRYILRHLESYSCTIRWINHIRGVIFTKKTTYLTSPTSSSMRFWWCICVKYANKPWQLSLHS